MKNKNTIIRKLLIKHNCNFDSSSIGENCTNFLQELSDSITSEEQKSNNRIRFIEQNFDGLLLSLSADLVVQKICCSSDYHKFFQEEKFKDYNQPIEFILQPKLAENLRESIGILNSEFTYNISMTFNSEGFLLQITLTQAADEDSVMCLIRNISKHYETMVKIDELTGLPSRSSYYHHLEKTLKQSKKQKTFFGILFFDLDRFKIINDSLGHRIGDELLISVGNRLQKNLKENEFIARLSGDEFTVVVKNVSYEEEVIETANRIISLFKTPFLLTKHSLEIKASIGVSIYPLHSTKIDTLVQYADTAMYTAKDLGGNQLCVFNKIQNFRVRKNFKMEQGLRKAIKNEEIFLVYQPQFQTIDNKITGLEALVRWKPKNFHEAISPADFIPLAELTGYINELGIWIIDQVCLQISIWKKRKVCFNKVSINVSRSQLIDSEITDIVFSIMKLYGIKGSELVFEITEDSIIHNNEAATKNLKLFNEAGIQIAIDDFGSGYSSFVDLKKFPFSELKIDKSIIDDIGKVKKNDAIVRAIISMGIEMDMKVVAEGVESLSQLTFLKKNYCHTIQGFLLGKPESPFEIEKILPHLKS